MTDIKYNTDYQQYITSTAAPPVAHNASVHDNYSIQMINDYANQMLNDHSVQMQNDYPYQMRKNNSNQMRTVHSTQPVPMGPSIKQVSTSPWPVKKIINTHNSYLSQPNSRQQKINLSGMSISDNLQNKNLNDIKSIILQINANNANSVAAFYGWDNTDLPGFNTYKLPTEDEMQCAYQCIRNNCQAYSYDQDTASCWLKQLPRKPNTVTKFLVEMNE